MPGNLYDDALEALGGAGQAPRQTIYDEAVTALDEQDRASERRLRGAFRQATETTPDRAATARRLSLRFGVPPAAIARNLDEWTRRETLEQPYAEIQAQTPALAAWLEEPANAAAVRDDLEPLGFLEWVATAPGRAWRQGQAQIRVGQLRSQSMFRELTADERRSLDLDKRIMQAGGALGAEPSWFRGAITGAARQLPNLFGAALAGARYGIPAGVTAGAGAAIAGQLGPQILAPEEAVTVPVAFGVGMTAGLMTGSARFAFELEAGLAYDEFLDVEYQGQRLDPDAAKAAALAAGALNAGLEVVQLGVLLRSIPGLKQLTAGGARAAVREVLKRPTVRAALTQAVRSYGGTLTAETATEVAQRAVTIMSGELAKIGTDLPRRAGDDIVADLMQEAAGAVQSFALIAAPGPAIGTVIDTARARRAARSEAFFTALAEGVSQSKTVQRMPEAAQAFLAQATKDGPLERVYAPVESFTTYWQSQGLDPAAVATELTGRPDAYQTAVDTGEDLAIPTARYAVKMAGTEHHGFFSEELRLGPEEMNAREARAFQEQLVAEETAAAERAAEAAAPTAGEQIRTRVVELAEAAGVPRETAEQYAELASAGFVTAAERVGVDPQQLFAGLGLQIERPDLAVEPAAGAVGQAERPAEAGPPIAAAPTEPAAAAGPTVPGTVAVPLPEDLLTRVHELEEELRSVERAAERDALTGVANRAALDKALPTAEASPETAVVVFDANHFGQVNKQLGHEAGDTMLREMATAIRQAAVELGVGDRVFRRGGDEFVVLAPAAVADQVRTRAEARFGARPAGDVVVSLTGTVGPTFAAADAELQARKTARKAADVAAARPEAQRQLVRDLVRDPSAVFTPEEQLTLFQAAEPVATLTGDELGEGLTDLEDLRAAAAAYYERALRQGLKSVERPDFGRVLFARSGGKKVISTGGASPETLRLLPAVPAIIERGEYLGSKAPTDPDGNIRAYHYFRAAVQVGDRRFDDVGVTVFEDVRGHKFYNVIADRAALEQKRQARSVAGRKTQGPEPAGGGGTTLDQSIGPDEPTVNLTLGQTPGGERGAIRIGPDRQVTITLFAQADLSTFLHELGHLFFQVQGDLVADLAGRDPSTLSAGQQRLVTDADTLRTWVGAEPGATLTREQQEQLARGFEAYLLEGQAPSLALRSAFARFRAWLIGVYRSLRGLHVALTEDVRRVLDRMLATDAAIAEAEAAGQIDPIFTTAEQAGMSEADFGLYRDHVADASRIARETLERQLLAEVQREQQAQWKAAREAIRATVAGEVHQQPVYRALAAIRWGTQPDGAALVEGQTAEPLRLDKAQLVARYGADRVARLPRPHVYRVENGLDPDVVAELFGFSSGDALLTAIEQAAPMRQAIDTETDRRMLAAHGSLLLDGTLHNAAQAAVANDAREDIVRAELRALGRLARTVRPFVRAARRTGEAATRALERERAYERRWLEAEARLRIAIAEGQQQATIDALRDEIRELRAKARGGPAAIEAALPPATVIREQARQRIARTRIRELKPQAFWAAARQAGARATAAAAQQAFGEAVLAKQQELFSLALYREAVRVREDVESRVRQARDLARPKARQRLGLAGESYLDQVDGILDRYEFARVSRRVLDRRASLRTWAAAQAAQGLPIDLPEGLLEETQRINFRELTVEAFVGVTDGLKHILHLARLKNKLLKSVEGRTLDEAAGRVAERIRATLMGRTRPPRLSREDGRLAWVQRWGRDIAASWLQPDTLLRELDGWQDLGPVYEGLKGGIDRAIAQDFLPRRQQAGERLHALHQVWQRGELSETLDIPELGQRITREELLAIALNLGTADNRAALVESTLFKTLGITDAELQRIVHRVMRQLDWAYVQSIWDYLDEFWPDIEASQRRRKGVPPERVQAVAVETPFGTYRGGYYPLVYDRDGSLVVREDDINEMVQRLRVGRAAAARTRAGFAIERQGSGGRPVLLSLSVIQRHLSEVLMDLALGDAIRDADRVLRHPTVRAAFEETDASHVYQTLQLWLEDVAVGELLATDGLSKSMRWLRSGFTLSAIGFNVGTVLIQPTGIFQTMAQVGKADTIAGVVGLLSRKWVGEGNVFQQVVEASPFMATRQTTFNKDITSALEQMRDTDLVPAWVANSYVYLIVKTQWIADVASWLGAHRRGLREFEGDEAQARHYADRMVARAQASGIMADRAGIERGTLNARTRQSEFVKLWTALASYMIAKGNVAYERTRRTSVRSPTQLAGWAVDMALLFSAEALLIAVLRGKVGPEDEPEEWLATLAHETALNVAATMPFIREVASEIEGFRGGGVVGSFANRTANAVRQVSQGEVDAALVKAVNSVGGVLLHYPSGQLNRILDASWRAAEGEDVPLIDYLIWREKKD